MNPKFPIYVISKGRHDCCLTAKFLKKDGVPFRIVCEPKEAELYAKEFPGNLLVAPENFSERGQGSIPVRNFVWEHSISEGHERHWILDDNIRSVRRMFRGKRIRCNSGPAFKCIEDFTDRYENVGIAGMNYSFFVGLALSSSGDKMPPFYLNVHVYSTLLILNSLKYRWRGRYNEDTDLCLQVLSGSWCTVLVNAFSIEKMATLTMKGGNMETLYKGSGRLKMARSLERQWPHVVTVGRRFKRPQHIVRNSWKGFTTPLKKKAGVIVDTTPNDYGLELSQVGEVKSKVLKKILKP